MKKDFHCFWVPSPDGFPTHFLLPSSGSLSCLLRVAWARLILPCSAGLLLWFMEHRGAIPQCQAQVVFAMQIYFPGQWKCHLALLKQLLVFREECWAAVASLRGALNHQLLRFTQHLEPACCYKEWGVSVNPSATAKTGATSPQFSKGGIIY